MITQVVEGKEGNEVRERRRNPRGEGGRLAGEIVDGAMALIEREGTSDSVTLRAVAREVGIAAPSIYSHFADRDAILLAVVERVFELIQDVLEEASTAVAVAHGVPGGAEGPGIVRPSDPAVAVDQLVAGCEAYVAFGLAHPAWYRTVFNKEYEVLCPPGAAPDLAALESDERIPAVGGEAFTLLVESIEWCRTLGVSTSADTFGDAAAVWVALHGTVSLWSALCGFPWPEREGFVRRLVIPLAHIELAPH
jgi:AcrR family transcriptional regulator